MSINKEEKSSNMILEHRTHYDLLFLFSFNYYFLDMINLRKTGSDEYNSFKKSF